MNILVIGESCRDIFNYGDCNRLCPEAPVPVFNPIEVIENGGMAMNVKANLEALGSKVNIYTNSNWRDITKTRFIDVKTNHMFMRLDCNDRSYKRTNIKRINHMGFEKYDAIVISDYNKGFLHEEDIEFIASKHDCVFIDTKKILGSWCDGVKFIKININEFKKSEGSVSDKLKRKMIITMGSEGCRYNNVLYSVPEVEIKDVSGAGDTFIAGLCYKYAQTGDIESSIVFANECATKVVQKRGVNSV